MLDILTSELMGGNMWIILLDFRDKVNSKWCLKLLSRKGEVTISIYFNITNL